MKKTLFIVAAVSMLFAACNKVDVQSAKKGMTLSAIVDESLKATITDNGDKSWSFSWETNDIVSVTAPDGTPYDFIYDGTSFKCEDAVPAEGEWTAVYPKVGAPESYADQDGTLKSAMAKYYMTGSCPSNGSAKLSMTMNPHVAILKVTNSYSSIEVGNIEVSFQKAGDASATLLGTISGKKTVYFVVPAAKDITFTFKSSKFTPKQRTKDIIAGKVYTYTYNVS